MRKLRPFKKKDSSNDTVDQMLKYIELAREAVYSEKFDIDALIKIISPANRDVDLLLAYSAIRVAADTKVNDEEPILKEVFVEILDLLKRFLDAEERSDEELRDTIINLRKNEAQSSLTKAEIKFQIDKGAPEHSYHWSVYQSEKEVKRPLTPEEKNEIRMLTNEIEVLKDELNRRQKEY